MKKILILIVMGLFLISFVFADETQTQNNFRISAPLVANAMALNSTDIQLEIRNGAAETIIVTNIALGTCTLSPSTSVVAGALQAFTVPCVQSSSDRVNVTISYTTSGSSVTQQATGAIFRTVTTDNQSSTCTTDDECEGGYECEDSICVLDDEDNDNGNQTQNKKTIVTKTKTRTEKRVEFTPWQKRNESECQEGCQCQGAVMMCKTENGKEMTIEAGRSGNIITITIEKIEVDTELEIESEVDEENNSTKIKAKMSNGQKKEIKQLPNNIRQRVREQVKICIEDEAECEMELKEIREQLMYEIKGEKQSRLFGLFKKSMHVKTQVNAETGEVTKTNKPWWGFLASEE